MNAITRFQTFEYEPHGSMMHRAPGLDVGYAAWQAMRQFSFRDCCQQVRSADLVLELPGPIYLFLIHFVPRGIPERETFIISGVLTSFQINVPGEEDVESEGRDRVLLYFGHLLMFCFCKPKYKTPFHLFHGLDSKRWPDNEDTRKVFIARILDAIHALGYKSLADFMPILRGFSIESVGTLFLDGNFYGKLTDDPMAIEDYINFEDHQATERVPVLHFRSKPPPEE